MHTEDNPTAEQDPHLKLIVQSVLAEHSKFRKLMRPLNIPLPNHYFPPANWGERVNKPT